MPPTLRLLAMAETAARPGLESVFTLAGIHPPARAGWGHDTSSKTPAGPSDAASPELHLCGAEVEAHRFCTTTLGDGPDKHWMQGRVRTPRPPCPASAEDGAALGEERRPSQRELLWPHEAGVPELREGANKPMVRAGTGAAAVPQLSPALFNRIVIHGDDRQRVVGPCDFVSPAREAETDDRPELEPEDTEHRQGLAKEEHDAHGRHRGPVDQQERHAPHHPRAIHHQVHQSCPPRDCRLNGCPHIEGGPRHQKHAHPKKEGGGQRPTREDGERRGDKQQRATHGDGGNGIDAIDEVVRHEGAFR